MSDEQRITAEQQSAAQAETQEQAQPSPEITDPQDQLGTAIPEKFLNKSPLEIIQAYNNLEKHNSKVASERAQEKKAREDLESKYKDLEARVNTMQTQPSQQQEEQSTEPDPFDEYEQQFDQNPKEAIKSLIGKTKAQLVAERRLMRMELDQRQASEYYNTQKRDNPEYAKLEPTMLSLAQEYGDLVSEDKVNSVKALKLLHLAAKGAKLEEYVSEASSKAKKETSTIRDEKRQAFSESPSSQGDAKVAFNDLSVEQMEKVLGIARS